MKATTIRLMGALYCALSLFACATITQECPGAEPRGKTTPKNHFPLGYVPDRHFPKGVKAFESTALKTTPVLQSVDLSWLMTPDDDQGQVGECTGHGLARSMSAAVKKATGNFVLFSPKFIYWNERFHMGTVNEDSGARIGEDGIFTLQSQGACLLDHWSMAQDWRVKPPQCAYDNGLEHLVIHAYKVDNRNGQDLERAMSAGFPVVYGIVLHSSFEDLNAGNYIYRGTGPVIGGHCMVFFKYDLKTGLIRSHNQWSDRWGDHDCYEMPLAIAHGGEVDDCYVIDVVKMPLTVKPRAKWFSFLKN